MIEQRRSDAVPFGCHANFVVAFNGGIGSCQMRAFPLLKSIFVPAPGIDIIFWLSSEFSCRFALFGELQTGWRRSRLFSAHAGRQ